MKFSVTGATGLLGNNLCRYLIDQGHTVRVSVRASSSRRPLEDLAVEIMQGDLESPEFTARFLDGVEGVFHAAALVWFGRSKLDESIRANVDIPRRIGACCVNNGIRMVHVSTTDALAPGKRDRPANEDDLEPPKSTANYVVTKRMAEAELLAMHHRDGLDVVIVNPGLLIGPYDWKPSTGQMILAATDGWVPLAPGGGISVCDVRQVCKAMLVAFEKGRTGQRYLLTGENLTHLKLWRRFARLAGRRGPIGWLSAPIAIPVGLAGDLYGKLFGETNVSSPAIRIAQHFNYYDCSRARNELGYDPGSLEVALADAWQWLMKHRYSHHAR